MGVSFLAIFLFFSGDLAVDLLKAPPRDLASLLDAKATAGNPQCIASSRELEQASILDANTQIS
jgi:hypothetical protein